MLVRSVIHPIVTRLGTAAGAFLVGSGLPADNVNDFINAGIALVLVSIDLATRHYINRGRDKRAGR